MPPTAVMSLLLVAMVAAFALPAAAAQAEVIVLPGATSAEGIAAGKGTTFYAGDPVSRATSSAATSGEALLECSSTLPRAARPLAWPWTSSRRPAVRGGWLHRAGLRLRHPYGRARGRLPVRGGRHLAHQRRERHPGGAWFTNWLQRPGSTSFGPAAGVLVFFSTLQRTGPGGRDQRPIQPERHSRDADGQTLIVAHSTNGQLDTVDPGTGASATIAGLFVPNVDGIVLLGRHLWAVQEQQPGAQGSA